MRTCSTTSFFKKSNVVKFFASIRLTRIINSSLRATQSDIDGNHIERGSLDTLASGHSSGR